MGFEDSLGTGMLGQLELRGLRFCELRGLRGGGVGFRVRFRVWGFVGFGVQTLGGLEAPGSGTIGFSGLGLWFWMAGLRNYGFAVSSTNCLP